MAVYESPKGNLIKIMLIGGGGFTPPEGVLNGVTSEQAFLKPADSPHSIAAILAHMQHWQAWMLNAINGNVKPLVSKAELGWPKLAKDDWTQLCTNFLEGIREAQALTNNEARLTQAVILGQATGSWLDHHSVGSLLAEGLALHNAHHLG